MLCRYGEKHNFCLCPQGTGRDKERDHYKEHIRSNKQGAATVLGDQREESRRVSSEQPGRSHKWGTVAGVPKMELIYLCSCCCLLVGLSPRRFGGVSTDKPKSWAWPRPVKLPKTRVGASQSKLDSAIALASSSPVFDQPMKTAKAGASLESSVLCSFGVYTCDTRY